jgi:hypothetical protein
MSKRGDAVWYGEPAILTWRERQDGFSQFSKTKGFGGGVPQTPKRPPRNARGRSDNDLRRCLFFVVHTWAGSVKLPALFNFVQWTRSHRWKMPAAPAALPGPAWSAITRPGQKAPGRIGAQGCGRGCFREGATGWKPRPLHHAPGTSVRPELQIPACLGRHQDGAPIFGNFERRITIHEFKGGGLPAVSTNSSMGSVPAGGQ